MLILKTFNEIFSFIDQSQSFNYRQIRQTDNASADYFKVIFRKKKTVREKWNSQITNT